MFMNAQVFRLLMREIEATLSKPQINLYENFESGPRDDFKPAKVKLLHLSIKKFPSIIGPYRQYVTFFTFIR